MSEPESAESPNVVWGVRPAGTPLRVEMILEGSPAATSGVQPGDVVTTVNGQPVSSYPELIAFLKTKRPGDLLHASLERHGASVSMVSVLAEKGAMVSQP